MPVPGGRRAGPGCLLTPFLAWNAADFFFFFCLRMGGHMDRKGLQVAKLGGPALCGVRGYVFYGVGRFHPL